MKRLLSSSLRNEVISLRKEGMSYGKLSRKFSVAKSTLHYWLSKIDYPKNIVLQSKKNWIKKIQPMGALANHQKRLEKLKIIEARTKEEIRKNKHLNEAKKAILGMLYWAEGSKGRNEIVSFANTDPQLIKLFVFLLRECYLLDERKFRVRVHLHYYHDEVKVKNFWSNTLNIPISQFGKSYRKKRSVNKIYRKNEAGICFVRYNNMAIKEEIMFYAHNVADLFLTKMSTKTL